MAFRKKADVILAHQPDILVIPECEHPDKLVFKAETRRPADKLWFGQNLNKGLGVFSYSDFRFKVLDIYDDKLKMIVPIAVSNGRVDFTLFAIWANNPNDPDGQYVEQVWKALHRYDALIRNKKTILIGDFNSNSIWDRPKRAGNHSTVVKKLADKGVHSLYHRHFNQVQGREQHPTLYLYRKKEKPYHLDYCFASNDFVKRLRKVEIGDYGFWSAYSDHVPIIVTFAPVRRGTLKPQPLNLKLQTSNQH